MAGITHSWIRDIASRFGLLPGGDFGFDTIFGKLYAGFGTVNRRVLLETDDTGWLPLSVLNGWEVYDAPLRCRVDAAGGKHIAGTVRYGALNYAVAQLPEPMRPDEYLRVVVPMRTGVGLVDITTDGYIIPRGEEEQEYDENGDPTGGIVEVGYLSLRMNFW